MIRRLRFSLLATSIAAGSTCGASVAFADDDPLVLMGEPTSFTSVIDSFDENDVFDLNLSVGFRRTFVTGLVQRETTTNSWVDIATHERQENTLLFGLELGIWRDLAIYTELPFVLEETRRLKSPSARSAAEVATDLCQSERSSIGMTNHSCDSDGDNVPDGAPLFSVPFRSAARSGVPYIDAGLAWGITNQFRTPELPTWLLRVGGRFALGDVLSACESGQECFSGEGLDLGVNWLALETRASWRFPWAEPYAGVATKIGFPNSKGTDLFTPGGKLPGYINTRPPITADVTVGVALIPWEDRERWQRFSFDVRFIGTYVSEGRDASPLFDALGTSGSAHLTTPQFELQEVTADPSAARGEQVDFNGMTDVQSHGRLGGRVGLEMQAARYIRFEVGVGAWYSTPYIVTHTDACNPNASSGGEVRRAGNCAEGVINAAHRPAIDTPGSRFRVSEEWALDFDVNATAEF